MNTTNPDQFYQSPESDTNVASGNQDLYAAFVGMEKSHYYVRRFMRFETEGSTISWNWPAFFFTSWWLLYRKMWLMAAIYIIGAPMLLALVTMLVVALPLTSGGNPYTGLAALGPVLDLLYIVFCFIVVPMFANWVYYRHTKRKVARVSAEFSSDTQRAAQLMQTGGTSLAAPIVVSLVVPLLTGLLVLLALGQ